MFKLLAACAVMNASVTVRNIQVNIAKTNSNSPVRVVGYNPDCDKISGACRPTLKSTGVNLSGKAIAKRNACLPCDCYATGSFSPQCDLETGQCRCRSGVIGQRRDSFPNPYAEMTLRGCEVVYDGCPQSYAGNFWWPSTKFGEPATESCPKDTHGKASRSCDNLLGGWQKPDMFNCTSELFVELRKQLSQIEKGELLINTHVAVKMAAYLHHATNHSAELYGADNIIHSASVVLDVKYYNVWIRIEELTNDSSEALILAIYCYVTILAKSQRDTYTNPFEIVVPNMALGLDVVTAVSLFGYEPDHIPLHQSGDQTYTTERDILPDTSEFLKPGIEISRLVKASSMICFPKYNNYLKDEAKFDSNSKFLVPLNLLGIKPLDIGEMTTKHSLSNSGAIISYAQYSQAGICDRRSMTNLCCDGGKLKSA
ncbi:starry night [Carabus blaptoides fortunei]